MRIEFVTFEELQKIYEEEKENAIERQQRMNAFIEKVLKEKGIESNESVQPKAEAE